MGSASASICGSARMISSSRTSGRPWSRPRQDVDGGSWRSSLITGFPAPRVATRGRRLIGCSRRSPAARSDLVGFLGELNGAGGDLYLERQAVDTTTPAGRALFQMLGVFAEFERSIIQERVKAGMERARKHGTKSGKPIGQPPLAQAKVEAIRAELVRGTGILKTARLCGTGVSAVQRIKRELTASEGRG